MSSSFPPSAEKAGPREWAGLAVLVLTGTLVSMDLSVLFLALPFLSEALRPSGAQLLWIMDVYGFVLAGLLISMGSLGDRIGRRRLLMAGAALFGLASLAAAFSTGPAMLIGARVLLGVAGATLAPSTLALLRSMFHDPGQRRTAIGVWTAGFSGGGVLGPIIGGLLLEHFRWGSVFLINVPVMVLLLALAPLLLPETPLTGAGRFDLLSAAMSLLFVVPMIFGIKRAAEHGLGPVPIAAMVLGLAVGVLFLRRQRTLAEPMIDVRLLARPEFGTALAVNALVMFGLMGTGMMSSQYLQSVLGMRPFVAALWSVPPFLALPIGVAAATFLAARVRPANVVCVGLLTAAAGFLVISRITPAGDLLWLTGGGALMAAGIGMVVTLATDIVVASAPRGRAGAAAALSETGSEFGAALGIAILGSVGTAVYQSGLIANAPAAAEPSAVNAAKDTIGAATEVAARLPERIGGPLLDAARSAFTDGIQVAATYGSVVLIAAAVLVSLVLRNVRTASEGHGDQGEPEGRDPEGAAAGGG